MTTVIAQEVGSAESWNFGVSQKLAPASSRLVDPATTEARIRPLLWRIPVTRIAELTPLDPIRLPVYCAMTPLARDLTTHMGKGVDDVSARVSALMEAIERVSAESVEGEMRTRTSYTKLSRNSSVRPVDPTHFDLPSDSAYAPERDFTWIESYDVVAGMSVLMAADLVVNPPSEGILHEVDTNGLAAGNTVLEAVVHGLTETIERDAHSQLEFVSAFGESNDPPSLLNTIDLASLPERAGRLVERLQSYALDVVVHEAVSDIGVATFLTLVTDYDYPSRTGASARHFAGWGTAPHAELALLRSLTEAVQSRLGTVQAARDSFNTSGLGQRQAARSARRELLVDRYSSEFSSVSTFECSDLRDDLEFLLERLAAAGLRQVIVTDMTRRDLGVPVVRVRVPGLAAYSVNRRRVGWRCRRHLL